MEVVAGTMSMASGCLLIWFGMPGWENSGGWRRNRFRRWYQGRNPGVRPSRPCISCWLTPTSQLILPSCRFEAVCVCGSTKPG
eukprot:3621272-Amphidinium_carterae.1